MTTTHTTRLDQCPPGLVHVAAHDWCEGGLTWKCEGGFVYSISGSWAIGQISTPEFEGVPVTAIPTETAAASTDPRVRAYVNTKEN